MRQEAAIGAELMRPHVLSRSCWTSWRHIIALDRYDEAEHALTKH